MSISFIKAPCGCVVDCLTKIHLLYGEPSEKHMAQHRELDAGIIHPYDENLTRIPVPFLVLRTPKEMMDKIQADYDLEESKS